MYHSITFAPLDMDSATITKYQNIERYADDPTDPLYNSTSFGDVFNTSEAQVKNTWKDWHLVPSTRPVIAPPALKSRMVDIPGGYGSLDLSEALTGYPLYERRTGSIEFIVMNDFGLIQGNSPWDIVYTDISNYLHGKQFKMILEDDASYYYEGRFSVNEWRSEKDYSRIVIDYDVMPFKKELISTAEKWLWDPFDFETGVILESQKITSGQPVYIRAGREYSIPELYTNTAGLTLKVARMFDYPCWGGNEQEWLSVLSGDLSESNYDYREFTLTGGIDIFPELEIGGNYIYGFQFGFDANAQRKVQFDLDWSIEAGWKGKTYKWGEAAGSTTIGLSGNVPVSVTIKNENVGAGYDKLYDNRESWYTPGAELTVSFGSTSLTYQLITPAIKYPYKSIVQFIGFQFRMIEV